MHSTGFYLAPLAPPSPAFGTLSRKRERESKPCSPLAGERKQAGFLLPACGEKVPEGRMSGKLAALLLPACGEKVPAGRMRGKPDAIKQQFPIPQTLLLRNTVAHHRETIMRSQANIQRARLLRKQQTSAEIQLWQALRDRRLLGMKFRRQHCIGPFFVDFVCLEAKVIVEVDGSQHLERLKYDDDRTRFLELQGFCVLRFWNDVVFNAQGVVLDAISKALQRAPHPPSAPSPTSREREQH